MSDIRISVIIPAYNYARTLRRAAESVITQLDVRTELLIIDDGSTDETPRVIDELARDYPGQFRSIRQVNAGLAAVRNKGIELAEGDYLVFLDADDEMVAGALAELNAHIEKKPDTRMVIGGHFSIHDGGRVAEHRPDPLPKSSLERVRAYLIDKELRVSNGACAMHRDVFAVGLYPERFRNAEDIPVFAQVFARSVCSNLQAPLARIYKHDDSLRHNLAYGMQIGDQLIAEVFDTGRLPEEMHVLRKPFTAQRYLSLFRTFMVAGDVKAAKQFYRKALRADWRAIFRWTYTRKALRLWLGSEK
ncbi:glycosyltransferase family 2 protein [Ectopseudomonas alcaliphila]|uniref:glycosyltransferase family 2 protein n=1 Tax=Ectopseudomonas alcaliphila TaxID=101564 RepID=UPI002784DC41|nr:MULTISPECIES: glycosyltransferase family 2 protein [Pseudomonas]MDP9938464.1 glycosyltransferase involved in cell wall biosynthesis [Pseudomonas sp. 3400]MDR7010687.1 glycosyltransferase involved in cell wall biosynthesis [Pseudomonas alcaliphila]